MKQDDYYKELVNTILDEHGNKQLPPTDSPQAVMACHSSTTIPRGY